MEKNRVAETEKINKLLFDSDHITSSTIADATGISYQAIYKWRTGAREHMGMNLDFAVRLSEFYDKYHS